MNFLNILKKIFIWSPAILLIILPRVADSVIGNGAGSIVSFSYLGIIPLVVVIVALVWFIKRTRFLRRVNKFRILFYLSLIPPIMWLITGILWTITSTMEEYYIILATFGEGPSEAMAEWLGYSLGMLFNLGLAIICWKCSYNYFVSFNEEKKIEKGIDKNKSEEEENINNDKDITEI